MIKSSDKYKAFHEVDLVQFSWVGFNGTQCSSLCFWRFIQCSFLVLNVVVDLYLL